jgi:hypothetical protein
VTVEDTENMLENSVFGVERGGGGIKNFKQKTNGRPNTTKSFVVCTLPFTLLPCYVTKDEVGAHVALKWGVLTWTQRGVVRNNEERGCVPHMQQTGELSHTLKCEAKAI